MGSWTTSKPGPTPPQRAAKVLTEVLQRRLASPPTTQEESTQVRLPYLLGLLLPLHRSRYRRRHLASEERHPE
jgi:hypothetical protein